MNSTRPTHCGSVATAVELRVGGEQSMNAVMPVSGMSRMTMRCGHLRHKKSRLGEPGGSSLRFSVVLLWCMDIIQQFQ